MTTLTTIFATYTGMKGLAVFIALCGVALKYWLGRRRFNRRNSGGMQSFRSYEHMRLVVFLERIGSLIGSLLMIGGVLLFLLFWITDAHRN